MRGGGAVCAHGVCLMAFMVKMKLRGVAFTVFSVVARCCFFPYSLYGFVL